MGNRNAELIGDKINIKCSVNKKDDYALKIPALGFHASTRTGSLEFSKDGLSGKPPADVVGMDYKIVRISDHKVIASGKIELAASTANEKKDTKKQTEGK